MFLGIPYLKFPKILISSLILELNLSDLKAGTTGSKA
jgi:hypothetical protein